MISREPCNYLPTKTTLLWLIFPTVVRILRTKRCWEPQRIILAKQRPHSSKSIRRTDRIRKRRRSLGGENGTKIIIRVLHLSIAPRSKSRISNKIHRKLKLFRDHPWLATNNTKLWKWRLLKRRPIMRSWSPADVPSTTKLELKQRNKNKKT